MKTLLLLGVAGLTVCVCPVVKSAAITTYCPGLDSCPAGRSWNGLNPFLSPAATSDYYGSGDVDLDGTVNSADLVVLQQIVAGAATQNIRADLNGDGFINSADITLMNQSLSGAVLPAWWNQLTTRQQRENWLSKAKYLEKTDLHTYYANYFACHHFAWQTYVHMAFERNDFSTESTEYDGGQTVFNLPVYVAVVGSPKSHAFNAVLVGDNPLILTDWHFFEPQNGTIISPGTSTMPYGSTVSIGNLYSAMGEIVRFAVESTGGRLLSYHPALVRTRSAPPATIIDNSQSSTSFTGTWAASSATGFYGSNSLWARDGATYTWTFTPVASGNYELAMWWTNWASRSTSIPVSIQHAGGTSSVTINQQVNGSQWNVLGNYQFNAGQSYRITITSQPNPTSTCADAVRFTFVPPAVICDNEPDLWHPVLLPYETGDLITINQQTKGGMWNLLGRYPFAAGQDYRVSVIAQPAPTSTCADAVQFVQVSPSTIIDNSQTATSSTGTWAASSATGFYGNNSLWARDGATYTWTFTPAASGNYELAMWWTAWASRSTTIPVSIQHAGGTSSVTINQQVSGGQWNVLGNYQFNAGQTYRITITSQPGPTSTCADAVRFTFAPATTVMDNSQSGTLSTGTWAASSATGFYGDNSLWARDGATYTWTFTPAASGEYELAMWWTTWASRSTSIPVSIQHAGGTGSVMINQQANGSQWNVLGNYQFNAGQDYRITITSQPGPTSTCADAVRFVPLSTGTIIDNGQMGTSSVGTWVSSAATGYYGNGSLWACNGATYSWLFTPAASGDYDVYMWWTQLPSRSAAVPVTVGSEKKGVLLFFEKMRNDMTRTTDIHVTDFEEPDFAAADAVTGRSHFSRIHDIKTDSTGIIHMLFESKDANDRQNLFYGVYDSLSNSLSNVSAVIPDALRLPAAARLEVTGNGQRVVFWLENFGHAGSFTKGIHRTQSTSTGWQTPALLEPNVPTGQTGDWVSRQFASYIFDTEIMSDGRIILACIETCFPKMHLTSYIYAGGTWSKSTIAEFPWSLAPQGLDLCRSTDGNIHLAYWCGDSPQPCYADTQGPLEGRGCIYHRSFDGAAWSAPTEVDSSMQASAVRIEPGPNNTLCMIWECRVQDCIVPVWSKCVNGIWQQPQTIATTPSFEAWYPTIAPLPDGTIIAAWSARSDDLVTIETAFLE